MSNTSLDVHAGPDGSLVIRPHGTLGLECAAELREALVHAVRRVRPSRIVLDLADVPSLDPINLGSLAAVCGLADDHHVAVFLDNSSVTVADQLAAAGVPRQRLRQNPAQSRPLHRTA